MASLRVWSVELSEMVERQDGLPEGGEGVGRCQKWGRGKMASLRVGRVGLPERGGWER